MPERDAAKNIKELIDRLQEEPKETEIEFVVISSTGKLITARISAKNAKALRTMLRYMEHE